MVGESLTPQVTVTNPTDRTIDCDLYLYASLVQESPKGTRLDANVIVTDAFLNDNEQANNDLQALPRKYIKLRRLN